MALLSRLRLVTVDVTGTLIAYRGQLGDYYCTAARSAGMPCPGYTRMHQSFNAAYADMARRHPCFGHASGMPDVDWWKTCVRDSFARAGYVYDDGTFEQIFRRIYSVFGTPAPYSVFPDARRFLRWLRDEKVTVGIISNADHRYRDVVLPALGMNQGSEWDFGVFSGVAGVEKPDRRIYEMALEAAGGVAPEQALHIGDSMSKDYAPARAVGMHALLLDRFRTADAERWRRAGAPVLPDLVSAQHWLTTGDHSPPAVGEPRTAERD
ncbi:haloacid dehalogenase-like hydrolase domain-containing protein 3 [Lolium rigidum]|uniref:haloacid dehalogenase-like hydrolase domain-containing protein 3 n=1 Tax=Lolium rigidum TaxID=89674 RepID=UPI001F5D2E19|nr:haloacid dehalogenase-like hydrolase domain-containing protein 3 [Lolium rigidum]